MRAADQPCRLDSPYRLDRPPAVQIAGSANIRHVVIGRLDVIRRDVAVGRLAVGRVALCRRFVAVGRLAACGRHVVIARHAATGYARAASARAGALREPAGVLHLGREVGRLEDLANLDRVAVGPPGSARPTRTASSLEAASIIQ